MENIQEQPKKQRYDYVRGYSWVKGQSGNPGGRPKGAKSLKQFAREYLEMLPPEEKIEFMKALPEELVFRMAEGNPHQSNESKVELTLPTPILDAIPKNNGNTENPVA
jgi:hypothetical protein